jgi:hypothetical protein
MATRVKIRSAAPSRPVTREVGRVYIDELAKIVDRQMGTLRKWERFSLPKRLLPKRGYRGWRYWTDKQVWGEKGIIEWMKENDMRPGNLVSDPSKEAQHVRNLRKPKYLDGYHIRSARRFVEQGKTRDEIIRIMYPRTRYARPQNLEKALVKLFAQEGWYFPPSLGKLQILPDKVERNLRKVEREIQRFEFRQDARDRTREMKKSA